MSSLFASATVLKPSVLQLQTQRQIQHIRNLSLLVEIYQQQIYRLHRPITVLTKQHRQF